MGQNRMSLTLQKPSQKHLDWCDRDLFTFPHQQVFTLLSSLRLQKTTFGTPTRTKITKTVNMDIAPPPAYSTSKNGQPDASPISRLPPSYTFDGITDAPHDVEANNTSIRPRRRRCASMRSPSTLLNVITFLCLLAVPTLCLMVAVTCMKYPEQCKRK